MSGNKNLGVTVAFASSGAPTVTKQIAAIQAAMKSAQTSFTSLNNSIKSFGAAQGIGALVAQLSAASTAVQTLNSNLQNVSKTANSLSNVKFGNFAGASFSVPGQEASNDQKNPNSSSGDGTLATVLAINKATKEGAEDALTMGKALKIVTGAAGLVGGVEAFGKFVDFLKDSVSEAAELNYNLAKISIQANGLPNQQSKPIVQKESVTFGVGQNEESAALLEAIRGGAQGAAQAEKVLSDANILAASTGSDLIETTRSLIQLNQAFGSSTETTTRITDQFITTLQNSNFSMGDIEENLSRITGTLQGVGIPLQQVLAAMDTLSQTGNASRENFRALPDLIASLINPSAQAAGLLDRLGISLGAANLKSLGLEGTLNELYQATNGNVNELTEILGSTQAVNVLLGLTGRNSDIFSQNLDKINNSAGAANKAFSVLANQSLLKYKQTVQEVDAIGITLGNGLLDIAGPILTGLNASLKYTNLTLNLLGDALTYVWSVALPEIIIGFDKLEQAFNDVQKYALDVEATFSAAWTAIKQSLELLVVSVSGEFVKIAQDAVNTLSKIPKINLVIDTKDAKASLDEMAKSIQTSKTDLQNSINSTPNEVSNQYKKNADAAAAYNSQLQKNIDLQRKAIAAANDAYNANVKADIGNQARANLPPGADSGLPGGPPKTRQPPPDQSGGPDSVSEDAAANQLLASLKEQAATFGQTSIQVIKYRETMGDLKGASEETKEQLLALTKTIFLQQQAMTVFDNFTDAFNSFAEGSETAKQAFQDFARTTIEQLIKMGLQYEIFKAIDPMAAGAGGFFGSAASGSASNAISSAPGLLGGSLSPSAYSPVSSNSGSTGPINVTSHVTVNAGSNADSDEIARKTTESVHKSLKSAIQVEIVNQMKPNGLFRRAG